MKSINLTIETQSFDNKIISVCHINKGAISIEVSEIAQKLFKINKPLFDRINDQTRVINASIFREETSKEKFNYNNLMSKTESFHEHKTKNILRFSFNDNKATDCHRFRLQSGTEVDITSDNLTRFNEGGPLNINNLTLDDLNSATEISKVSRINCFEDLGIESFIFVDNLKDNFGLFKIKHKVSISYEHQFKEYIKNIMKELLKGIGFLKSYFSSSKGNSNYDTTNNSFSKSFASNTFSKLGLDMSFASRVDLSDPSIVNSSFGQVGTIYYNALSVLEPNVNKSVYHMILKKILPTKLASPETIEAVITKLSNIYDQIDKTYLHTKSRFGSLSHNRFVSQDSLEVVSNLYHVNREKLGYRLFEEPVDYNKITKSNYKTRCNSERERFYPSISTDGASYMYPSERQEFTDISNSLAFLTPLEILMEGKTIITDRGLGNINIEDLKVFRLIKASKYRKRQIGASNEKLGLEYIENTLSDYNLQIEPQRKSIKEKNINGETDGLIDSKYYVGDDSYFQSFGIKDIESLIRPGAPEEKKRILNVVSGIVPKKFLRPLNSLKSIIDIQITRQKSTTNNLITQRGISLKSIPPHIKFMMTSAYQPAPHIDPIKNLEMREVIEETQKNIFQLKALVGFESSDDGILNLNMPIYREVDQDLLNNNRSYLVKALDYEVPELGILKDKMLATIYNNLYLISQENL